MSEIQNTTCIFFTRWRGVQELSSTSETHKRKGLNMNRGRMKIYTRYSHAWCLRNGPSPAFEPGGVRDPGGGVNTAWVVGSWSLALGSSRRSAIAPCMHPLHRNDPILQGHVACREATKKNWVPPGRDIRLPTPDADELFSFSPPPPCFGRA